MCGRYGRRADKQRIAEWMQTHNTDVFDDTYLAPSYNVAPQSFQPVVRLDTETGKRELTVMRWGLVPFWILLANSGSHNPLSKAGEGGGACLCRQNAAPVVRQSLDVDRTGNRHILKMCFCPTSVS